MKPNINGVFPHLTVKADHLPARTETGIGALMPWANRLWFITYVAHKKASGAGTGLFTIDDDFNLRKHPASCVGTYANRMVHSESHQVIIGPHLIDPDGRVRTFPDLVDIRLAATCRHLTEPEKKVYFLGMEGEFLEAEVYSLRVKFLFDLKKELGITGPHFKDAFTSHGWVVVANNSYYPADFQRGESDGRLAEWDGKSWHILARTQFNTVTGRYSSALGEAIYAVGQDRASALFYVYLPGTGWKLYRLPKGTHTQDHAWTTEWPRIREVESERWLMDASGIFYELPAMTYADSIWGVVPICRHLRIIGDFCSWNGLLGLAGDQTTPINDSNPFVGQPQANLWFGKTDDLWHFGGKPAGWGGPWWETAVKPGQVSDPFLMTGFTPGCLHVNFQGGLTTRLSLEVDFQGTGNWQPYTEIEVKKGYASYVFPEGFASHWIRLIAHASGTATAQLFYR
ncbi:MAG: hypothetical protein NC911_02885 [Candidatus Omnitrophica bacterium]|nr:hypothetical protein [Candidatus Omnitrophota bacterium]